MGLWTRPGEDRAEREGTGRMKEGGQGEDGVSRTEDTPQEGPGKTSVSCGS